jgi:hypothetical protein
VKIYFKTIYAKNGLNFGDFESKCSFLSQQIIIAMWLKNCHFICKKLLEIRYVCVVGRQNVAIQIADKNIDIE